MTKANQPPTTEEHAHPDMGDRVQSHPALVCAYPTSIALPVPSHGAPVGRAWFLARGLNDTQISGEHAKFSRPGGVLHVEDAGSRNGTWINGARLAPSERVAAPDGSVLRLGSTLLVVRDGFVGAPNPASPLGALVGPFGLRSVRESLEVIVRQKPGSVLLEGETGTGKELAAAVCAARLERATPFAAVNTAGLAAGVFEAQLFGYVRGAYSGSGAGSKGVFVSHDGGTVFLDEIGDLPLELQPKLLRVLENGDVLPVGADRPRNVDIVVIAATNRPLEQMVKSGTFRLDLFARLAQARVELPPLRERAEDLWAIATALLAARGLVLSPSAVDVEAVERLMLHDWPGNVRELASALARAAAIDTTPSLRAASVQKLLGPAVAARPAVTRHAIDEAIARCGGNETHAARLLGISRGKLRRILAAASS